MLTLVLGGIRSGKSAFAARLAGKAGVRIAVIATGVASDDEMRARIDAHRRARPEDWTVYEESEAIGSVVPTGSADVVLLDSIDGWLGHRIDADQCLAEVQTLCERAPAVIAVSSEVGLSLVPLTPAGREFSDALGAVNQGLAAAAARVYLVVAGLPVVLKEAPS
jgi:adenosylcobinamide kinase/adenosylcobinamide-phosphate guanylyltransferase